MPIFGPKVQRATGMDFANELPSARRRRNSRAAADHLSNSNYWTTETVTAGLCGFCREIAGVGLVFPSAVRPLERVNHPPRSNAPRFQNDLAISKNAPQYSISAGNFPDIPRHSPW